eukprot:TRINITY_DN373_c0_g1_i8.p4 TRINITY_DN373_c0_g1~~TRINITY_DN373_c0_g1_i8.p4  ORF type:complete len:171 (+),score=24.86 TRINITY_DN373_c0_g1_i8:77-514(+)
MQASLQRFSYGVYSRPSYGIKVGPTIKTRRYTCISRRAIEEQKEQNLEQKTQQEISGEIQEEEEDILVEGYWLNKPSILEQEWFGVAWKVGFVTFSVLAVVFLVYLATPVIDNTVLSFPSVEKVEGSEDVGSTVEIEQEIEELQD